MPSSGSTPGALRVRDVTQAWLPLAASWLLMGLELPLVSAVLARLPDARIHLAAYGGVVMPVALLIESPIIMLLSASTALSRDRDSYRIGRRFMLGLSGGFSALHALVAFSPLYDWIARSVIGVPADIVEPARLGLRIMTPWTLAIGLRRFHQGVLIRFGHSHAVGIGTGVRLATLATVLTIASHLGSLPGVAVGTLALASGVVFESIYAGLAVRPVIRTRVMTAPRPETPLTTRGFLRFYLPLMVTPVFSFFVMPLSAAAMSRMPRTLDSLATWPVISGLLLTARSTGFGFNEVVVAMLDRPHAARVLKRFASRLAVALSSVLLVMAATPLAMLWFGRVSALPPTLVSLAIGGLWLSFLLPGITAMQSLYQGAIVHSHHTRGVTESVLILSAVDALILAAGVRAGRPPGLHVALAALTIGSAGQLLWLWWRGRPVLKAIEARDAASAVADSAAEAGGAA